MHWDMAKGRYKENTLRKPTVLFTWSAQKSPTTVIFKLDFFLISSASVEA